MPRLPPPTRLDTRAKLDARQLVAHGLCDVGQWRGGHGLADGGKAGVGTHGISSSFCSLLSSLSISAVNSARSPCMPAEFLIGPDLTVLIAHYADYVMDHLPFEVIERFLSA